MTSIQKIWDTHAAFSQCTGKGITCNNDSIRLRQGITFADEIGRCNDRDR